MASHEYESLPSNCPVAYRSPGSGSDPEKGAPILIGNLTGTPLNPRRATGAHFVNLLFFIH